MEDRLVIVVITYNRINSLKRLLTSLLKANYFEDKVDLIISIDHSGKNDISEHSNKLVWPYGNKRVIAHTENLGLRNHVLFCGNLVKEYKFICVFEDDMFVSSGFYNFVKQTKKLIAGNIAGISLYTHLWNYIAEKPFTPLKGNNDYFLMQQAQSWGQVWSNDSWSKFYSWYLKNTDINFNSNNFPEKISSWSKSSWLKYFMKYLVDQNLFFVYPYHSFTTNFTEIGTHNKENTTRFQVPLDVGECKRYYINVEHQEQIVYDIFFENLNIELNDIPKCKLTIDIYGQKKNYKKYLLTTRQNNFKIINKFPLFFKPHELNIKNELDGDSIFLYDTSIYVKNKFSEQSKKIILEYYYYLITTKEMLFSIISRLKSILFNK